MAIPYRFVEACALLPMLYVAKEPPNSVFCVGSQAELFATDVLRWRDVSRVYLLDPPARLRDKRIVVGQPPVGSCSVVLSSPDEPPDRFIFALSPKGVLCASTIANDPAKVGPFLRHMRQLFPRSIVPWREYLIPEVLYGVLASPSGAPKQVRNVSGGALRLNDHYLKCLFTFGADELPLVFGPQTNKTEPQGVSAHA